MFKKIVKIIHKLKTILDICIILLKNSLGSRKHTYCSYLWDYATIWENGDVTTCCHYGGGTIGNINKNDLSEIWNNSSKLKMTRWLSLNGCLPCFNRCTILSLKERKRIAQGYITYQNPPEYPRTVHIQHGTLCNFNCIMCPQDHKSNIILDNEILKTNIDWSLVKRPIVQGGETLAIKSAKEFYIWLTERLGKKVLMLTNGVLINDDWANRLVINSDVIYISVNAATEKTFKSVTGSSDFAKVIANIKKLVNVKREYRSDVTINFHFTIVPENIHEITEAIFVADSIGCDCINYGFDRSIPAFLEDNKEIYVKIKNDISTLLGKYSLRIKIEENRLGQLGFLDTVDSDNLVDSYWELNN